MVRSGRVSESAEVCPGVVAALVAPVPRLLTVLSANLKADSAVPHSPHPGLLLMARLSAGPTDSSRRAGGAHTAKRAHFARPRPCRVALSGGRRWGLGGSTHQWLVVLTLVMSRLHAFPLVMLLTAVHLGVGFVDIIQEPRRYPIWLLFGP